MSKARISQSKDIPRLTCCCRAGAELQEALRASENVDAARVSISEAIWHRCKAQLTFIKTNYEAMDKPLLILHNKNLSSLAGMIRRLTSIFKDLIELKVRRDENVVKVFPNDASMTYTYRKGTLDETIFMLVIWQQMTDPTWVLMVKLYGDSITSAPAASQNFSSYTSKTGPYNWKLGLPIQSHPYTCPAIALQDLDAMSVSDIPFSPFNIAENEEAGIRIIHKIGPLSPEHFQALGKKECTRPCLSFAIHQAQGIQYLEL